MQLLLLLVGILVIAAISLIGWMIFKLSRRGLSKSATTRIRALIERADHAGDPVLRILEYDKALDQLLLELGYKGTTGEKLYVAGPRFKNKEALWRGHKLRNIIAHEQGATASADDADNFRSSLKQAFMQVAR